MVTKEVGTALIWCGYFIALIKQTMGPLCFLVYFVLTPVSLLLLSANTISVKSAQLILCPKLVLQFVVIPHFLMCFLFPARILPKQGIWSSTLLLAIPQLSSGMGPVPLLWDQYTSEADFPSLTRLPPGLFPSAEDYMFGNVLTSPL